MSTWLETLNKKAAKTGNRALSAFSEAFQQYNAEADDHPKSQALRAIDGALSVHVIHSNISKAVDRCFEFVEGEKDEAGAKQLQTPQVLELAAAVAKELKLPPNVFADLEGEMENFDVDGSGTFDLHELKRLFKRVLQVRRTELGGKRKPVKVPVHTTGEAGYTIVKELGRGGQGAMYLATKTEWFKTKRYCIKFYNKKDPNAGGLEDLLDEYELMISLDHSNIAKTYEVFQDSDFYYLVNEPYFGGDLTKLAQKAYDEGVSMSEKWWRPIFRSSLEGLAYLHSYGIMHCDLKEPNIMIASGDSYKAPTPVLIDFGLSASFLDANRGICGTPGYIPPETWQSGCWFPSGDCFSLGITFFQLLSGQVGVLLARDGNHEAAAFSQDLPWEAFPQKMVLLADLIEQMTLRSRSQRPKPAQALKHEWFASVTDADLPQSSLRGLVTTAVAKKADEDLKTQLTAANTLADLQTLANEFQRQDPKQRGIVDATYAATLLSQFGAETKVIQKTMTKSRIPTAGAAKTFAYGELMEEVLAAKEHYDTKFVKDLFDRLDTDHSGTLSVEELHGLLSTKAFDISPEHIDDLLKYMDMNGDGIVSFEEFSKAAMDYGRVANRSDLKESELPAPPPASSGLASVFSWAGSKASKRGGNASQKQPSKSEELSLRLARSQGRHTPSLTPLPAPERLLQFRARRAGASHRWKEPEHNKQGSDVPVLNDETEIPIFEDYDDGDDLYPPLPRLEEPWLRTANIAKEDWEDDEWRAWRPRKRLLVRVVGARGLLDAQPGSECNAFVTCGASSASFAAFQSEVVYDSGAPVWNFEELIEEYQVGDSIDFAVLSAGPSLTRRPLAGSNVGAGEDRLIGTASIPPQRLLPHGYRGILTLLGPNTGIQGLLEVEVFVLQDPEVPPSLKLGQANYSQPTSPARRKEMQVSWGRSWTEVRQPVTVGFNTVAAPPPQLPQPLPQQLMAPQYCGHPTFPQNYVGAYNAPPTLPAVVAPPPLGCQTAGIPHQIPQALQSPVWPAQEPTAAPAMPARPPPQPFPAAAATTVLAAAPPQGPIVQPGQLLLPAARPMPLPPPLPPPSGSAAAARQPMAGLMPGW